MMMTSNLYYTANGRRTGESFCGQSVITLQDDGSGSHWQRTHVQQIIALVAE